jgi:hypothetical protein
MTDIGISQDEKLIDRIIAKYTSKSDKEMIFYRKALSVIKLAAKM